MKLLLNSNYILRGWKYLPFAYCNTSTGDTIFISKKIFSFLNQCDGTKDIVYDPQIIKHYIDLGVIRYSDKELDINQHYKIFSNRFVKSAHWAITNKCNFKCRHCFISAPHFHNQDLSFNECCKIVDELYSCGIFKLSITGGEPFMREDFIDILKYIKTKGLIVTDIYSNGSLISELILDKISYLGLNPVFHISYDGINTHNWLRGIPIAESITKASIKRIKQKGFKIHLSCCLYQDNLKYIYQNIEYFSMLGIDSIGFGIISFIGEWKHVQKDKKIDIKDVLDALIENLPRIISKKFPIEIDFAGFIRLAPKCASYSIPEVKRYMDKKQLSNWSCCEKMRNTLYINPRGALTGCEALTDSIITKFFPTILNTHLNKILIDGNPFMEFIDQRLKNLEKTNKECAKCSYYNICHGGCRGNANCHGGFWNVDKVACTFFKQGYYNKIIALMKEQNVNRYFE